jgi:hypothetical protein
MKTRWLTLIGVAIASYVAGTFTPVAFTQSTKAPKYVAVAYMKVTPSGGDTYLAMERDLWKPIHRKLIASGAERAWTLYGVLNAGTGSPYNYVTVQTFDSLDQYYSTDFEKAAKDAHPDKSIQDVMNQTLQARDAVSTQLLERLDHVE